ncbi:MAG: hypothetical protein NC127_05535 [Muribaculum sp.]|nr:hypothetical protein [Muribaculum sp.]
MNKIQLLSYVVGAIICPSTLLSCADDDKHDEPVWTAGTTTQNVIDPRNIIVDSQNYTESYTCRNYTFNLNEISVWNIVSPVVNHGETMECHGITATKTGSNNLSVYIPANPTAHNRTITVTVNSNDIFPSLTFIQKPGEDSTPSNSGEMMWTASALTYFIGGEYHPVLSDTGGKFTMNCINYSEVIINGIDIDGVAQTVTDSRLFSNNDISVITSGQSIEILYPVPGAAIKKSIKVYIQATPSASTTISMLI